MFSFGGDPKNDDEKGRRERKKALTRRAIVGAARGLMRRDGFEGTTMEAVAEAADVSVGSLYNYFGTKRALLLGIMSEATQGLLDGGRAVIEASPNDARDAVVQVLHSYVDQLVGVERGLFRHAIALGLSEPREMAADFASLDMQMLAQLGELVVHYRELGGLTRDVSVEQAALALYGPFCIAVMVWVSWSDDAGAQVVLRQTLDQQLDVVFRGLEPRPPRKDES